MPRKAQTESLADGRAAPRGVAAVNRALTLLSVFRETNVSLSLAARTQLYKTTVLRLQASLGARAAGPAPGGRPLWLGKYPCRGSSALRRALSD